MFCKIIANGKKALSESTSFDRFFFVFWLLGPFVLLIERSPADIWLTVLSLAFVCRVIKRRDAGWLKYFWVRAGFAFWGACLLSAALSSDPYYALGEAFVWFRFPLFAMAATFWLAKDRRLFYLMLLSTSVGFLTMCGIITAEMIYNGDIGKRLSWPFGDLVSGNYLAKVGLPVVVVSVAITVSQICRNTFIAGLISVFGLTLMFLTGERINTLTLLCAGILAGLVWRPNWKIFAGFIFIFVLLLLLLVLIEPWLFERSIIVFLQELPTGVHSAYYRAMAPGLIAFKQSPVFGVGTANLRNLCPDLIVAAKYLVCHPHPHNYYIQMLGETGIFGFVCGSVFLFSIVQFCFKAAQMGSENVVLSTAWVIPFALFWPIASTADFFGQWNNTFMWTSVALALGATNLRKNKS